MEFRVWSKLWIGRDKRELEYDLVLIFFRSINFENESVKYALEMF